MKCDDCGTKLNKAKICSNCHEEFYILNEQSEFVEKVSKEFLEKAKEQEKIIKNKHSKG